jgi:dTMP kinase
MAFVGVDGAGKSRQAGLLHRRLGLAGHASYLLESKDDFNIEMLRRVADQRGVQVLEAWGVDTAMTAQTLGSLRDYFGMVAPLLSTGCHVVEARSFDARPAFARSAGAARPELLDQLVALCPRPTVTFFLRVTPEEALRRIDVRGIDQEDPDALRGFAKELDAAAADADWIVLDGARPADELSQAVWEVVG